MDHLQNPGSKLSYPDGVSRGIPSAEAPDLIHFQMASKASGGEGGFPNILGEKKRKRKVIPEGRGEPQDKRKEFLGISCLKSAKGSWNETLCHFLKLVQK